MKRIWIATFTVISLILPVLALTEAEVEAQVAAQGKEAVTGNILIWFLCAVAFLKVAQKIDSFMSTLGINVGHTGGNLLGELMIAFKGVQVASGGAFGHGGSHGSASSGGRDAPFLSGGLAGAVERTTERHAASSITDQKSHTVSRKLYDMSVAKGGGFANSVIGAVAKGSIPKDGIIKGERAAEAMTSYFGHTEQPGAPVYTDTEIGGGHIIGKESVAGTTSEFAMYNADQYMKPDGAFTVETAADGSKWYKQMAVDTVQKTPYMDAGGEIKYKQEIVQKLPQIPRRKDKV